MNNNKEIENLNTTIINILSNDIKEMWTCYIVSGDKSSGLAMLDTYHF
jgi:hypothetical protein